MVFTLIVFCFFVRVHLYSHRYFSVDQIRAKIVADNLDHWLKFPKGELITKLIGIV